MLRLPRRVARYIVRVPSLTHLCVSKALCRSILVRPPLPRNYCHRTVCHSERCPDRGLGASLFIAGFELFAASPAAALLGLEEAFRGASRSRAAIRSSAVLCAFRWKSAGGQNVNKVNTKVELRFEIEKATWMEPEVRQRLRRMNQRHVNKDDEFVLTSQRSRSQQMNIEDAFQRLQQLVNKAAKPPKVRKMKTGLSDATKEQRKQMKRHRSEVKQRRKGSADIDG